MNDVKFVQLSTGDFTIVDECDFESVNRWRWSKNSRGYARRTEKCYGFPDKTLLLHRFLVVTKSQCVDHKNGFRLDNRRLNLRPCTRKENLRNTIGRPGSNEYKGVRRVRQRWFASIFVNGRNVSLGGYPTAEDAARAYDAAALFHFGEFSKPNFP